jgi:hypothetical protein
MRVRDLPGWMPIWYGDDLSDYLQGEVGILTDVSKTRTTALSLTMKHQGKEYNGWLAVDLPVIEEIFQLIETFVGRPITEVAEMEIHGSAFSSVPTSFAPAYNVRGTRFHPSRIRKLQR